MPTETEQELVEGFPEEWENRIDFGSMTEWEEWARNQSAPIYTANRVPDLKDVPVDDWDEKGEAKGAFIQPSIDANQTTDSYVLELPPGVQTTPEKHIYEQAVYVLSGRGSTTVWTEDDEKQSFEWEAGSLFGIPLNTSHQHFNVGDEPARFFSITSAPTVINHYRNEEFVFDNDFVFEDRFSGETEYFSSEGEDKPQPLKKGGRLWVSNFIPDVDEKVLFKYKERGGAKADYQFAGNSIVAHTSEFPVGTYKKAHRHPNATGGTYTAICLNGEGFTRAWRGSKKWSEAEERVEIPWKRHTAIAYKGTWWHQHFNLGDEPARYMYIGPESQEHPGFGQWLDIHKIGRMSPDQIEFAEEDPQIIDEFERRLDERGVEMKDPAEWHE